MQKKMNNENENEKYTKALTLNSQAHFGLWDMYTFPTLLLHQTSHNTYKNTFTSYNKCVLRVYNMNVLFVCGTWYVCVTRMS